MFLEQTGMDGEIVDSLFCLFDQCVAVDFPTQVFYLPVHFFQCLVDGDCPHRDRTVADDPFAGFMNIVASRKIHQSVASPFATPYGFFDLFVDAGREGGIADVGVDLHQEFPADDHRFGFGVVDVCRDDGASGGNFFADKFGSDI